ncbi:MAG TPA: phospho-N-acetylmuramoyl-pentapeptide-transferase [Phycisphaerae bacterium]|nr:phospho-N-acetylmuramoyl-pentapeptide-transferase [Phycisphaerae bacterium]
MLYHFFYWLTSGASYAYKPAWFRATLAVVVAFLIVWALGPRVIRTLVRLKIGDRPEFDHQALNEAMRNKANTPTMGGVLISVAIAITVLLLADLTNFYIMMGLFCLVWLSVLGGVDDWLKLTVTRRSGTRDGLRLWEKLVFQVALGVLLALFIYRYGETNLREARWGEDLAAHASAYYNVLILPFTKQTLTLSAWAFVPITIIVIASTSNAVNLTDGMDGLASGCMALTAFAFTVFTVVVGSYEQASALLFPHVRGAAELAVLCGAMVGACLGFLWYNAYPAQVFMGDTGSLPLGGLMGYVAIVTRLELMLFIVGGVFVIEAASVIIQVGYYKATHGKRVFRCSPLHHHYHLGGLNETQVVMRFWLLAALFTAFALLTIKLR